MSESEINGNCHRIILGIDYGTTYSGISYVTTDKSDIKDINIITSWPGETSAAWKTPTRIAYDEENSKLQCNKWGFEVTAKLTSYAWTKLFLDKNAEAGEYDDPELSKISENGMMKLPPFRTAEQVCEDFLREMHNFVNAKLQQKLGKAAYDRTPMEVWITLPAIWSDEAKGATLRAAKNAGFGNRPGDEIVTIAEPEAAAVATLGQYSGAEDINKIEPFEHILICDCGGGTVDITTYTIMEVQPRLVFEELCVGVGKCGATYIDRNLYGLLAGRFGKAWDEVPYEKKGPGSTFMANFGKLKRSFGHDQDFGDRELGPITLDVEESDFYDSDERAVILSYADMRKLFDPVATEIVSLISQQVSKAYSKREAKINRVVLVGGFGESGYLHQTTLAWCEKQGIRLMSPENAQAAVVRGAALRGLEGLAPRMKFARRHYGFTLAKTFREGIDSEENAYIDDFDDRKLCRGRMTWCIAKGEGVFKDDFRSTHARSSHKRGKEFRHTVDLYSSALENPQERYDDLRVEKTKYNKRLGKKVSKVSFEVRVIFGNKGDNLIFTTVVNGQSGGTTTIEFPKN